MKGGGNMDQTAIGKLITRKRKEKNMTQEQLAERIGVSNKTVSKWERGACMPDYSTVEGLCQALDMTLGELLSGEEKQAPVADNSAVLELLRKRERLKHRKLRLIGWILIAAGIAKLLLSRIIGGTEVQEALSGLLLGFSVPETVLGLFFCVRNRGAGRDKVL